MYVIICACAYSDFGLHSVSLIDLTLTDVTLGGYSGGFEGIYCMNLYIAYVHKCMTECIDGVRMCTYV